MCNFSCHFTPYWNRKMWGYTEWSNWDVNKLNTSVYALNFFRSNLRWITVLRACKELSLDKNKLKSNKQLKLSTSLSQDFYYIYLEGISFIYLPQLPIIWHDELILIWRTAHFDSFIALLLLRFVCENTASSSKTKNQQQQREWFCTNIDKFLTHWIADRNSSFRLKTWLVLSWRQTNSFRR